jgi:hypothetical protein
MDASILEVRDRAGWLKAFPLRKSLIHVGGDPRNDVVLDPQHGSGVAPRHLQLVGTQEPQPGYRAINLSGADIPINAPAPEEAPSAEGTPEEGNETEATGEVLAPRQGVELADGDRLQLGEFTLVLHLRGGVARPVASGERRSAAGPSAPPQTSNQIGLRLSLPRTSLDVEAPVEGTIVVRNLGEKPGVQFALELEGLDPDCYEMGPGPILFPGAEKGVSLRLRHPHKPQPLAGDHVIRIVATSEAYPGEVASVSETIHVPPFHSHRLRFVTPDVPRSGPGRRRG